MSLAPVYNTVNTELAQAFFYFHYGKTKKAKPGNKTEAGYCKRRMIKSCREAATGDLRQLAGS